MSKPKLILPTVKERLEREDVTLPEPIVSGLLFRKSLAVLGAPEDSFKTQWALQLAISLAAGKRCYSHSIKKSVVVYLILEGAEDYILERIEEKIGAMEVDRDEVMSNIRTKDCAFLRLDNTESMNQLTDALVSLEPSPDVIIFDPITYTLSEDVRFSPARQHFCTNVLGLANSLNCVMLLVVHCRKGTQDNNNMDDFLGTSIVADIAATRIKLYRNENRVNMYAKTRYAEPPDLIQLLWKSPLLQVDKSILSLRKDASQKALECLRAISDGKMCLSDLTSQVLRTSDIKNEKTVRAVLDDLAVAGNVSISRLPKQATKIVTITDKGATERIYAS